MPVKKKAPSKELQEKAAKWEEHERKVQEGCDFDLGSSASITPPPLESAPEDFSGEQVYLAQRLAAKVAKALSRARVPQADQLALGHLALMAIAKGPKSTARDIAVTALKVFG